MITQVVQLNSEDLLFDILDEVLNANGVVPQLAGVDSENTPFIAWLDESGGDCVIMSVTRLIPSDDGCTSYTAEETPGQGETTSLVYPVTVLV